jgi:HK97 family phage portal protein
VANLIDRLRGRSGGPAPAEYRDDLENPSVSLYTALVGLTDGTLDSTTGAAVTAERSVRVVAFLACVKLLAETIAALPINVFERDPENGKRMPVLDDGRVELLNDEPNAELTAFNFWAYLVLCVCLWGNAYVWVEIDGKGDAIALWPIAPTKIRETRRQDGARVWLIDDGGGWGSPTVATDDEVMHFHGIGLTSGRGLSNVREGRNALGIAMSAEDYAGRMFQSDGNPGAVLSTDKTMTDEQYETFRSRWRSGHEGLKNSHKFALLPPGMSYEASGFDPTNLQMIEAREFQVREIARLMRIPGHMIGATGSTSFAAVEQQSIDFVTYCLNGWLVNFAQTIKRGLFGSSIDKGRRMFVQHDPSGLLRADSISRARIDSVYRLAGILTSNEIREGLGREPVEGGDVLWQPVNVQIVGDDGKPITPGVDTGLEGAADAGATDGGQPAGTP